MAVLSSMTILSEISVNVFGDFPWALILNVGMSGIGFYALRIILLTVCLKIVLFPFDLFQRYKMRKNQLITLRLKPQLENLEKAYGSNPNVLKKKQAELNRREGMSYLASCLPMIVTMIVFIWLWQSLLATANYKQFDNYVNVYEVYESAYTQTLGEGTDADYYDANTDGLAVSYGADYRDDYIAAFRTAYEGGASVNDAAAAADAATAAQTYPETATSFWTLYARTYSDWFTVGFSATVGDYGAEVYGLADEAGANRAIVAGEQYCRTVAQNDVYDYYFSEGAYADGNGYQRDSFLWIKDIWSADTPWANSLAPTQSDFMSAVGSYGTDPSRSGLSGEELQKIVGSYDVVMARVIAEGEYGVNGFLVLPVLAVLLNVLTQIITRRQQKQSGQAQMGGQNEGCMKVMVFVMPVIMGVFALMYCAAFTLYMVTNSTMTLIINLIGTKISKKMIPIDATAGGKGSKEVVSRYGRPDPSDRKK